MTILINS